MALADNGSDRSNASASSFKYEEFFSVLMYYYNMTQEDILNRSRPFLNALYQEYINRACENLGVSPTQDDEETNKQLKDSDYPSEFVSFSQAQREKMIEESGISDEEYLKQFNF